LEEIQKMEDAVLLVIAADHFLLENLADWCCLEIERLLTVENVWQTLNLTCCIQKVADVCSKVFLFVN